MEITRRQSFGEVERNKLIKLANKTLYTPEGAEALAYLKEQRSLSDKVIEAFQIGYVPYRVNHECRGRLITPLYNPYGEAVAITTRRIERKDFWHEQFDKSLHLYGLHIAKKGILRTGKAILVEGEFDVTCLHSFGIDMAVGVCGSAFTAFQASLLARYCNEVYLCFDRDVPKQGNDGKLQEGSGQRALKRAMQMRDEIMRDMKFIPVLLPYDTDPDDFLKLHGRKAFAELLTESKKNFDESNYLWMN